MAGQDRVVVTPDGVEHHFPADATDREISRALNPEPTEVPRSFGQRMADAAIDMPIGMVKQAGRYVQMIPGVTAATDAMYGLPKGASAQAMQPTNTNQKVGGYLGDLALAVGTGGAEAGGPIMSRVAGYNSAPTIAERAKALAEPATEFGSDTLSAIKTQLTSGGPITPEKVAKLAVKYGKDAVKAAIVGAFGYGAYRAVSHVL